MIKQFPRHSTTTSPREEPGRRAGGKPYAAPGFGNWFREICDEAGCHDVSAHSFRKATARRLAEIGCTAHQIAAITGHASIAEVQRYTKAADRNGMAKEAMAKLVEGGW